MEKEVNENYDKCFMESVIDEDRKTIRGVVLFGTKKSKNKRTYSENAVNDLVDQSEGIKIFVNHNTKNDVRDLRDWIGVANNVSRRGDKIKADVTCREEYFPLLRDVALLQPSNVGMSLNARCSVRSDSEGEVIESVKLLRSYDAVSSAATTFSLFESLQESIADNKKDLKESVEDFLIRVGKKDKPVDGSKVDKFIEGIKNG